MDVAEALEFVRNHPRGVMATTRADGRTAMSPIACTVDADGRVVVSTRETAMKVRHIAREPHVAICVLNDGFYGDWVQVEGEAEIVHLPDAMDGLVDYYRRISGEHPDWDDYRAAMTRDRRVLLRIAVTRAGPNRQG
jgi:PPOX class probable F420-dependent enzyme